MIIGYLILFFFVWICFFFYFGKEAMVKDHSKIQLKKCRKFDKVYEYCLKVNPEACKRFDDEFHSNIQRYIQEGVNTSDLECYKSYSIDFPNVFLYYSILPDEKVLPYILHLTSTYDPIKVDPTEFLLYIEDKELNRMYQRYKPHDMTLMDWCDLPEKYLNLS